MALTIIRDTSSGAPVLTNAAGSLIPVLDFCLVTTLGWTKPFSGTNKAAYKQPAGTNGFYLRVDDTVATNAQWRGCETMAGVDDTSVCFPTNAQVALGSGLYVYKGNSASASPWTFASDGKIFYLLIQYSNSDPTSFELYAFGDIRAYKSGDQFATLIMANTAVSATTSSAVGISAGTTSTGSVAGHYLTRSWSQLGSSVVAGKVFDNIGLSSTSYLGGGNMPYPCPIDGGLHMAPLIVNEIAAGRRGLLPGIWAHGHSNTIFNSRDTIPGNNDVSGRTFEYYRCATNFALMLEVSDTWG